MITIRSAVTSAFASPQLRVGLPTLCPPAGRLRVRPRTLSPTAPSRWSSSRATRFLPPIVAALFLLAASSPISRAQEDSGSLPELAIETVDGQETTAVHVQLEPGERETIEIRFSVDSESPIEVTTYVADAISPPNGGFGLAPQGAEQHEPATWIQFDAETLTLDPGDPLDRTVTIDVPGNAEPGQYVAALAIQTTEPIPVPGAKGIGQIVRVVAAIAITVPGDLAPAFELGEPALVQGPTGDSIQIPIENTGNIPVHPQGTLTLETLTGEEAASIPVTMDSLFAGGATYLEVALPEPPPPGEYRLTLNLTDSDTGETAAIADAPFTVPALAGEPGQQTPPAFEATPDNEEPSLIVFGEITVQSQGAPIESVQVSVKVANVGQPVTGAKLTLEVSQDGQVIESVPISEGVTLVDGVTSFSTSYAPEAGFTPGTWTFRVTLESVDANGDAALIAHSGIIHELNIP